MDYPKLRNVDIFPIAVEGKQYIAIRDPLGLMSDILLIPQHMAFFLSLMDGAHSVRDMQVEFVRRFGRLVMSDEIQRLISQLDENCLLENERSAKRLTELKRWFNEQPTRKAAHAGISYPEDAAQLRALLDSFYQCPDGPGMPLPNGNAKSPIAIVAPHIDLRRGGSCYAWAYYKLAGALLAKPQPTTFVILGIAHCQTEQPFAVTCKDFETPFGIAKTNLEFVEQLTSHCRSFDPFSDEYAHRFEHSIEFQVLFLQHAFGDALPFTVVPILCGSFERAYAGALTPMELEPIKEFVNALRYAIEHWHERTCVIASVDLSHVGMRFGHTIKISPQLLQWLRRYDGEFLSYIECGDADEMIQFIARNRNFTNIDAAPAVYVMLKAMSGVKGQTIKYEQSLDPDGQSVVTFSAVALYAE